MSWFVVYTKPRAEGIAHQNLMNQGFEVFFPQVLVKRRRSSGWVVVEESMFPRYVFVQLVQGVDDFSKMRSTRGCVDLVKFGFKPATVPTDFIHGLRAELAQGPMDLAASHAQRVSVGQSVRVAEGAFEGLMAEIAELKANDRALVLMDVLGGKRRIELSLDVLE